MHEIAELAALVRAAGRLAAVMAALAASAVPAQTPNVDTQLQRWINSGHRLEANRLRDVARHPYDTLRFWGVQPHYTVVEVWPGASGWWAEILAPYLKEHGQYMLAVPPLKYKRDETGPANISLRAKLMTQPPIYGSVMMARFPDTSDFVPPASVDLIISSGNLHAWIADGTAASAFAAFFAALKPGGVLGLEDHRASATAAPDPKASSGYVREDLAIELAQQAGFKLAGRSQINANPKDTKDYAAGVWALPPTYRLGERDRARYRAIGESDRFTLKFVKP